MFPIFGNTMNCYYEPTTKYQFLVPKHPDEQVLNCLDFQGNTNNPYNHLYSSK